MTIEDQLRRWGYLDSPEWGNRREKAQRHVPRGAVVEIGNMGHPIVCTGTYYDVRDVAAFDDALPDTYTLVILGVDIEGDGAIEAACRLAKGAHTLIVETATGYPQGMGQMNAICESHGGEIVEAVEFNASPGHRYGNRSMVVQRVTR